MADERDDEQQDDGIRSEDLGYGTGASPLSGGGLATATTGAGSTNAPGGTSTQTGASVPTGTGMTVDDAGVGSQSNDGNTTAATGTPQTRPADTGESVDT